MLKIAKRIGYRRNAKVTELMSQVRLTKHPTSGASFGVISFYEGARPWETSLHLSLIFKGMTERADALGYRLEPLWLRAPGMTYRRFRSILDARGIEGLMCFGITWPERGRAFIRSRRLPGSIRFPKGKIEIGS